MSLECPCHAECYEGCNDCENPVCQCRGRGSKSGQNFNEKDLTELNLDKDIENNLDYKICTTEESVKLGNCHLGCDYELDCVRNCTLAFYENVENCPCKVSLNFFKNNSPLHI